MAEADPLIGATVGDRYRLVEQIGEGGMATVYRAEHQLTGDGDHGGEGDGMDVTTFTVR